HADCYQYFCVPEYGTANGRLHFHAVHFMRTLPTGSVDPNFGRRVRNRRQLNSLQNTWPYGYSMPIAVRYTQDAFSRSRSEERRVGKECINTRYLELYACQDIYRIEVMPRAGACGPRGAWPCAFGYPA